MKLRSNRKIEPDNVTWQNPQVWVVDGHKCYMYQSANQWLNWRVLKIEAPDGSIINDPDIPYKTNISPKRKNAEDWLRRKIEWHNKTDAEKSAWLKANANARPENLLW